MSTMRFPLLLIPALLIACGPSTPDTGEVSVPPAPASGAIAPIDTANSVVLTPITGTVRFNGVYVQKDKSIHYFMRFFPRGNVALIAGPEREGSNMSIRNLLTEDVQSGQNNAHNTPVEQRGDSLFFRTMTIKGAIRYAGVVHGDTARFLKVSDINGRRAMVTYVFEQDKPEE